MSRNVMKFGGAALQDAAGLQRVGFIIQRYALAGELVVVVSAMGKTTNSLELLAKLATSGDEEATRQQFERIRTYHQDIIQGLFGARSIVVMPAIKGFFDELQRVVQGVLLLGEFPSRIYDRIMAFGELISSRIVEQYLLSLDLPVAWLDARRLISTDATFKDAEVIWTTTDSQVQAAVLPLLAEGKLVLTQGYIASTPDGKTTTLGREGSDYTAAILTNLLEAEAMTVWKDVPAVMSADPRKDPNLAHPLHELTYAQAVEMTFYGATVIHPKTIKPLQNKGIPLRVRSFLEPETKGTTVREGSSEETFDAPCTLRKGDQALLVIRHRDFSFMDETHLRRLFNATHQAGLKVNLVQTTAITLTLCVNHEPEALESFASQVADGFFMDEIKELQMVTLLEMPSEAATTFTDDALIVQQDGRSYRIVKPLY